MALVVPRGAVVQPRGLAGRRTTTTGPNVPGIALWMWMASGFWMRWVARIQQMCWPLTATRIEPLPSLAPRGTAALPVSVALRRTVARPLAGTAPATAEAARMVTMRRRRMRLSRSSGDGLWAALALRGRRPPDGGGG